MENPEHSGKLKFIRQTSGFRFPIVEQKETTVVFEIKFFMNHPQIIIVGQGLAGTLLSFILHEHRINHRVIVHPDQPSASQVAAGMYNPLVFKRITKSWKADLLLPVMHQVYERMEILLDRKLNFPLPLARLIRSNEKPVWETRIESQLIQSYFNGFYPSTLINGINPEFEIALISQSGWVNLEELIKRYRDFLRERNLLIECEFNHSDLILHRNKVVWKNLEAKTLVFCEGAYATQNPFFTEVPFYLSKGDVLTVEIEGLNSNYIINKDVFILPKPDNRFIIGSNYVHDQTHWDPTEESKQFILTKIRKITHLPINILEHRSGIRPTIKDRKPVLGRHQHHKSLAIFNGLGTKGVMLAPYYALQMVRLLTEPLFELPDDVSLARFSK